MDKELSGASGSPSINPPKSINQINIEPSVSVEQINNAVNFLVGRICTIIDASYPDKEQAKAVKQLIKNELYEASNKIGVWVEQMSESGVAYPFPYWKNDQIFSQT